jgi:hypothetical protein
MLPPMLRAIIRSLASSCSCRVDFGYEIAVIAVTAPAMGRALSSKEQDMRVISLSVMSLALAAPAIAAADKQPPDRMPSEMTPTEIKAYNADIDPNHPYYIKCRKSEVMGSLVKKLRVCRTNQQWKEASAKGNDATRESLEAMGRTGGSNGN